MMFQLIGYSSQIAGNSRKEPFHWQFAIWTGQNYGSEGKHDSILLQPTRLQVRLIPIFSS